MVQAYISKCLLGVLTSQCRVEGNAAPGQDCPRSPGMPSGLSGSSHPSSLYDTHRCLRLEIISYRDVVAIHESCRGLTLPRLAGIEREFVWGYANHLSIFIVKLFHLIMKLPGPCVAGIPKRPCASSKRAWE